MVDWAQDAQSLPEILVDPFTVPNIGIVQDRSHVLRIGCSALLIGFIHSLFRAWRLRPLGTRQSMLTVAAGEEPGLTRDTWYALGGSSIFCQYSKMAQQTE